MKRKSILVPETLFERLTAAAIKESAKRGRTITAAEYIRNIANKHLKRKGL